MSRADEREFTHLARQSLELHRPWINAPTTPGEFELYVARSAGRAAAGLLVCDRETHDIAGFINLNEIVLGPYQRGLLGYGVFAPHAGRGYMTEGLEWVINYAFDELHLHRLEADIQPANIRSRNLVRHLGFHREGLSPGFIYIDGEWTDHERWAITSDMSR